MSMTTVSRERGGQFTDNLHVLPVLHGCFTWLIILNLLDEDD